MGFETNSNDMQAEMKDPDLPTAHRTMWRIAVGQFVRHRLAVFAVFVLLVLIALVVLAPLLSPHDPLKTEAGDKLLPPSSEHPLGTDDMGRDVLSRILYGGRVSLTVGFLATLVSLIIGTVIGGLAGFFGGALDNALMRVTDLFLSFPTLFVLILLSALLRETQMNYLRNGPLPVVIVIAALSWMGLARLVRASFLSLREQEFVEAARSVGAGRFRIMSRHILPNAIGVLVVNSTLILAFAIIMESGLSYLGFGVQPPTPTWGNMLNRAQIYVYIAPWLGIFPGLMIFLTVISINYIGDGLRDALDPFTIR
jgi:peptide/nickel transport system permease protein